MKKTLSSTLILSLLLMTAGIVRSAEMTWTYSVRLSASVQAEPARVELNWLTDPFPISGYTVHRKSPAGTTWGEGAALPGHATGYVDEAVSPGQTYEYQVIKHGAGYTGYGYIAVGIQAPLVDERGRVVLVVDDTIAAPLAPEIERLQRDLAGDGWTVVRQDVSREAAPADVRRLIQAEYRSDPERTRAVFLLGHIPVVRSGNLNVDGHGARPMPADVFYGEIDGVWTDPNGDGIYDQSTLPSSVELQVGRVDFADLPGNGSPVPYPSELELLRRYLDKDHAFRHAVIRPTPRALIGDAMGDANGQAYAAAGYRNFAALVGPENIVTANSDADAPDSERWITRITADDYLWTWAGGAGSDSTIAGVGTHPPYADARASDLLNAKGTFYMLLGSWLGDWSKPDNMMRTALAAPNYGLAVSWSGRPHHFYHHMGVGESIGYGIRLSQNNNGLYQNQVQRQLRGVHIALLGDPTLRLHPLAPPKDLTLQTGNGAISLQWKASPDAVSGYHIYRSTSPYGPFSRITPELVSDTQFSDTQPRSDQLFYQVKAVALHSSPSGSYVNASQGILATASEAPQPPAAPVAVATASGASTLETIWIDDQLPTQATGHVANDRWNWIAANPTPMSGSRAHQSDDVAGVHYHFFVSERTSLTVSAGDTLFAYVYLDPSRPPRQIMLSWLANNHWEHRAYWGENLVAEGIDGGPGRRAMGPLPPTGKWVRLEVPASAVDMENRTATGMGFTLFDGRATWDKAGKVR